MKEELLSIKEPELEDFENFQTIHEKACCDEDSMGVTEEQFDKEIMRVSHRLNHLSQQKPVYKWS